MGKRSVMSPLAVKRRAKKIRLGKAGMFFTDRDDLWREVLTAIAEGHESPVELAKAALSNDLDTDE